MGAPRRFDWGEARQLYGDGVSITEIARRLGVSWAGVQRVVVPGRLERSRLTSDAWASTNGKPCIEGCGRTVSYVGSRYHSGRCRECASVALATTATPTTLQCCSCREWKPDEEFPHNRAEKFGRRGRHNQCRVCQTAARRDHRQRNREADNRYHREYRARRKEGAVT